MFGPEELVYKLLWGISIFYSILIPNNKETKFLTLYFFRPALSD
jgi:hypothetical protein